MKKTAKIFIVAFLLCLFVYICKIENLPSSIVLMKGENLNFSNFFGLSFNINNEKSDTILTSTAQTENTANKENFNVDVKLLGLATVKNISVSVIEDSKVIPVGQVGGLKLYTNGVLVVGMGEIKNQENEKVKPYNNSGIIEGDRIVKVNGKEVIDTNSLIKIVNSSKGEELEIIYIRDNQENKCTIKPAKTDNNQYKLGLWVRDSEAGIGTLTFYEPTTGKFAALGHGIVDSDTENLVEISNGEFSTSKIISIIKGIKGTPGKIQGSIENQQTVGVIYKNSNLGVYGTINTLSGLNIDMSKEMEVAKRQEINLGEAEILCSLDGEKAQEYKIEIEKIYINNDYDNKSMLIKVTDENLLEKTGGIIQGMSGSPIIQNGKFIGAITNVLVNDPTKGYGVFGDIMVKEMKN